MGVNLLLGDEAVACAALDAGIAGAFSYPGTPATEILECVQRLSEGGGVSARWSANEKVAYEEALGMSYVGRRSLVAMKHVGLNVAADPMINSALTGANGALVLAVADDPGMHSSQNEQDSRFYGDFARIPMFEPCNQQETYDMTREAFPLSERLGVPVMVRLVTRLAHSRANVTRRPAEPPKPLAEQLPESSDWILLPSNARRRFRRLLDIQEEMRDVAARSPYNRITLRGRKGIIASGLAYNYVMEVIGDRSEFSLLKIGAYPTPAELVRRLVDHCDDILVVEDGYPYIETLLTGMLGVPGKTIRGRRSGDLAMDGEMTADRVRAALGLPALESVSQEAEALPGRPPALCKGCPHCDTFSTLHEAMLDGEKPIVFSDIGCYTLSALPPYNAVNTCVDMGASISMGLGAAKAGAHPVVCTIGDSTFTHSGLAPLLEAAHEDANMTVIVLDNATVGMTGQQETFVTGEAFLRLLRGLGVDARHLVMFEPHRKNQSENAKLLRCEIDHHGLSVVVASRACIHCKASPAVSAAIASTT